MAKPKITTASRLGKISDASLRGICERLVTDLDERDKKEKRRRPARLVRHAKNVLLAKAYRHTCRCLEKGTTEAVNEAVMAVAGLKSAPADAFASFLLLICALRGEVTKSTRNQIRKQAIALGFAHRSSVPPRYLIGFIYQEGGLKRIVARHTKFNRRD